jgi:copper homeostasis protein CutC
MPGMLFMLRSEALEALISLGIPRVLTSGGQPRAMQVGRAFFDYQLYVAKGEQS